MEFLKHFKTRWDNIPGSGNSYRLLCSNETCSLSCANLKHGKISVTSVHGKERHSYEFTKNDMVFVAVDFLNHLSEEELEVFTKIFNKVSPNMIISAEKLCD